jgi:hypothetical protein
MFPEFLNGPVKALTNTRWMCLRAGLVVAAATLCSGVALAEIPEPDAVIYGQLKHRFDQALTVAEAGQVSVLAKVNGTVLAEYALPPGASAFLLRIPMDDGIEPRQPNTAKAGDRVRLFIRNNQSQKECESVQSYGAPWILPADRAPLVALDLSVDVNVAGVATDTDGDGMPDYWEAHYGLDPFGVSASNDADGDGMSDIAEFVAGTDPKDPESKLLISLAADPAAAGQLRLAFTPAWSDRSYSVQTASSLDGEWTEQQIVRPACSGQCSVTVPLARNAMSQFIRVAATTGK